MAPFASPQGTRGVSSFGNPCVDETFLKSEGGEGELHGWVQTQRHEAEIWEVNSFHNTCTSRTSLRIMVFLSLPHHHGNSEMALRLVASSEHFKRCSAQNLGVLTGKIWHRSAVTIKQKHVLIVVFSHCFFITLQWEIHTCKRSEPPLHSGRHVALPCSCYSSPEWTNQTPTPERTFKISVQFRCTVGSYSEGEGE